MTYQQLTIDLISVIKNVPTKVIEAFDQSSDTEGFITFILNLSDYLVPNYAKKIQQNDSMNFIFRKLRRKFSDRTQPLSTEGYEKIIDDILS